MCGAKKKKKKDNTAMYVAFIKWETSCISDANFTEFSGYSVKKFNYYRNKSFCFIINRLESLETAPIILLVSLLYEVSKCCCQMN